MEWYWLVLIILGSIGVGLLIAFLWFAWLFADMWSRL